MSRIALVQSQFDHLFGSVNSYLPFQQVHNIERAYRFASKVHQGQKRKSGEPYITHPITVAQLLANIKMDAPTIMAALLHDVIEDTPVAREALQEHFGEEVAFLVDGVSKLGDIKITERELSQAYNFQKLALATARDLRVVMVKLADRLHNLRTIEVLPLDKRRRIARETMDIYAPIANRLGIENMRQELEDLCLRAVYPLRYARIKQAVNMVNRRNEDYLMMIRESIETCLQQAAIPHTIIARSKNLAGIYNKMAPKHSPWIGKPEGERQSFRDIMDIHGFRVLTENVEDCYRTLGVLHQLYPPISARFKDHIAVPKSNGYQSLHTTLLGKSGHPIEVQVRTREMDAVASKGIAAHGIYKDHSTRLFPRNWVQDIHRWQQSNLNPAEFVESAKLDLYVDEILVFSPKGQLYSLPRNATAVDFAYAVHTDIGNHCCACKVDDQLASLDTKLENGQRVEIITAAHVGPRPSWAHFVVTSKALHNINQVIRQQHHEDAMRLGHRLLGTALEQYTATFDKLDQARLTYHLNALQLHDVEHLFAEIGRGNLSARVIAARFMGYADDPVELVRAPGSVAIGAKNTMVNYAQCCRPIPGDRIVAVQSAGKGLVVHTAECTNVRDHKRNRQHSHSAHWDAHIHGDFNVLLILYQQLAPQIIAQVASCIVDEGGGVENLSSKVNDVHMRVVSLLLAVRGRQHLAQIIRCLRRIRGIEKIVRPQH